MSQKKKSNVYVSPQTSGKNLHMKSQVRVIGLAEYTIFTYINVYVLCNTLCLHIKMCKFYVIDYVGE